MNEPCRPLAKPRGPKPAPERIDAQRWQRAVWTIMCNAAARGRAARKNDKDT